MWDVEWRMHARYYIIHISTVLDQRIRIYLSWSHGTFATVDVVCEEQQYHYYFFHGFLSSNYISYRCDIQFHINIFVNF